MNEYRVIINNHDTGEILEQYFLTLDNARLYYDGAQHALSIAFDTDCECYMEQKNGGKWECISDAPEDVTESEVFTDFENPEFEDCTEDDGECMDYLCEGNAPCDNVGYCIGTACPYYFKTCH